MSRFWKIFLWTLLSIVVVLGLTVIFFGEKIMEDGSIFSESYSKDDGFIGPDAGADLNDLDSTFRSLAVSKTDPDLLFVGTENNGIFKSTDGGASWQWITKGIWHDLRSYPEVYDLIFDKDDENILYAAMTNGPISPDMDGAAGFYKSVDGGESWDRYVEGLPNVAANSIAEDKNGTLYLGIDGEEPSNDRVKEEVEGGIYQSVDNGENWTKVLLPEYGDINKFNIITIRDNAIFSTGLRWTQVEKGESRGIDSEKALSLVKSDNLAENFERLLPKGSFCYYFDVSADGQTVYYTDGNDSQGYKSTDGGESFKKTSASFSNLVRVSPHDSDFVLFANGNQLYKSTDGMNSQKEVFRTDGVMGFDDIEYSLSDPDIIYACGDKYSIYKSIDGGESFNKIASLRDFIK